MRLQQFNILMFGIFYLIILCIVSYFAKLEVWHLIEAFFLSVIFSLINITGNQYFK